MAIETTASYFVVHNDSIEITVNFDHEPSPPNDYARVSVFIEKRDCPLSELKAETVRQAKVFLSQALSSLPD